MTPPGILAYLIGNLLSLAVAVIGAFMLAYQAVFAGGSGWLAIGAVFGASASVNAANRIDAYHRRKREWDAMSGAPPKQPLRIPGLKQIGGAAILGVGAWGAVEYGAPSGMEIPVAMFWLEVALLVGRWVYVLVRRSAGARKAKPPKTLPVTVLLPVPRHSPDAVAALSVLPGYCGLLVSQSRSH